MTQQAGVSAEAVAKLVETRLAELRAAEKYTHELNARLAAGETVTMQVGVGGRIGELAFLEKLSAALATAPPEQADVDDERVWTQPYPEKGGAPLPGATHFINPDPKQQSGEHRADSKQTSADPPQAVGVGALHDESFQLVDKWFVSKCDKAEIPTILLNWKQTMDSLRPLVAAALAAHDQKVREAAQAVIDWEIEYRTLNNLGRNPPHPFVQLAIALASPTAVKP